VTTLPANWMLAIFGGLVSAPLLAFGGRWGVPYLMRVYGASRPGAALAVSLMLVGWAVGSPLIGWLSDRMGKRRAPMIVGAAVALAALLAVLYVPGLPLPVLAALLFVSGAGSASMVICYALAREINPGKAVGTAYGFVNMVVVGSGAVFQPIIGWLLDRNWDGTMEAGARVYSQAAYDAAFVVLPGSLAVGLVVGLLVREPRG
jgi:MFS family permease